VPYVRAFVAVPDGPTVSRTPVPGSFTDLSGAVPEAVPAERGWLERPNAVAAGGFYPSQPYRVSEFRFRRTRVLAVDFFRSQFNAEANVRRDWDGFSVTIGYDAMDRFVQASAADPLLASLVVNQRYFPRPSAAAGAPDPHFSLSGNWVKIPVSEPGIYAITGDELARLAGVNLSAIADPASFRLFTAGGRAQPRDLTQTGGTWTPGNWMTEVDIIVEYGGDASFDPGDRIIFYGQGSDGWLDTYEPGAPREAYYRHMYTAQNYYYLSWDDTGFSGSPARMASTPSAPSGAAGELLTFEERRYFEKDAVQDFNYGGDGWLWLEITTGSGATSRLLEAFTVTDLVPSVPQTFRSVAVVDYRDRLQNTGHYVRYLMNGTQMTEAQWNTASTDLFEDGPPVLATGSFIQEGANRLSLVVPRTTNPMDFMYFAWYSVFYQRRLRALDDVLFFTAPDSSGTANLSVSNFGAGGALYLFDVTNPARPRRMTGFEDGSGQDGRTLRFNANLGGRRYYAAMKESAFLQPTVMTRHFPVDLRNTTSSPNMLIVANAAFLSAASRLQSYRAANLPFFDNPRVSVVTTEAIYDNFSGGQTDPMAIRNYVKFLYDNFDDGNGTPSITYLLFLGDANQDFRNNASSLPNYVTTNLHLHPIVHEAYTTDDWFALMDVEDTPGSSFIDVAVGRLPAASRQEADFLVDRIIAYENQTDFGTWRDRVILLADDEWSPRSQNQSDFIAQSESIAHGFMKRYLDAHKIYLTEFPEIQHIKPASRLAFLSAWNEGALLINYVGHGSSVQMADEQVFLAADVGNLVNGLRLPLFLAVSCTIGDFAGSLSKSLSERLLLRDGGGVAACVTASQVTFIGPNSQFDFNVFAEGFFDDPDHSLPLGIGLMRAKFKSLSFAAPERLIEENNQKYNLLGDPAMRLLSPRGSVALEATDIDTLTAGRRHTVRGTVLNKDGETNTGFSGTVELMVREPDDDSGYTRASDGFFIPYRYPGGTVYRGSADVVAGAFSFTFKVPRFAGTGRHAYALAYANDGQNDAVITTDAVVFVPPGSGDVPVPVDGAPRVEMGFKSGQGTVKPGAVLQAVVRDADGINILETTSEGRIAILFDDSDLPLNVTDFFKYDYGGSDTSGTVLYPLPELEGRDHRVVFKVADTFGQIRLDTLFFATAPAEDYTARVVTNYPNPFQTDTYFLVEATDRTDIRLDIFTTAGRRIRSLESRSNASGEVWIHWDGRDGTGDEVANGVYLYVARVDFPGADVKTQVLRGSISKIR